MMDADAMSLWWRGTGGAVAGDWRASDVVIHVLRPKDEVHE
jgi:hypothetical protein